MKFLGICLRQASFSLFEIRLLDTILRFYHHRYGAHLSLFPYLSLQSPSAV